MACSPDQEPVKHNAPLIKAVARARTWYEQLVSGGAPDLRKIARRNNLPERYVGRGRPKKRDESIQELIKKEFNRKVTVTENGQSQVVTKLEAIVKATIAKAAKGDHRALKFVLEHGRTALEPAIGSYEDSLDPKQLFEEKSRA